MANLTVANERRGSNPSMDAFVGAPGSAVVCDGVIRRHLACAPAALSAKAMQRVPRSQVFGVDAAPQQLFIGNVTYRVRSEHIRMACECTAQMDLMDYAHNLVLCNLTAPPDMLHAAVPHDAYNTWLRQQTACAVCLHDCLRDGLCAGPAVSISASCPRFHHGCAFIARGGARPSRRLRSAQHTGNQIVSRNCVGRVLAADGC